MDIIAPSTLRISNGTYIHMRCPSSVCPDSTPCYAVQWTIFRSTTSADDPRSKRCRRRVFSFSLRICCAMLGLRGPTLQNPRSQIATDEASKAEPVREGWNGQIVPHLFMQVWHDGCACSTYVTRTTIARILRLIRFNAIWHCLSCLLWYYEASRTQAAISLLSSNSKMLRLFRIHHRREIADSSVVAHLQLYA